MEQPLRFSHPIYPNHVFCLHKSLYGLRKTPREWFKKLTSYLYTLGFHDSKIYTSLYFKYDQTTPYFLLIYVDDILLISSNLHDINNIIKSLNTTFSMCKLRPAHYFLDVKLIPKSSGGLLSQSTYITSILKKLMWKIINLSPICVLPPLIMLYPY